MVKIFPHLCTEIKVNHYSQKGLAAAIGLAESSLSKKMNGHYEFTLDEMEAIRAQFPNATLDYLFARYDTKE